MTPPVPSGMAPRLVPDLLTPLTPAEAATCFWRAWRRVVGGEPPRRQLALLLAQSCLETGWWRSVHRFNFGNVKVGSSWEGDYCQFRCNEVIGGRLEWFDPPHPQTSFRAHATADEGAAEHLAFLSRRPGYAAAWAALLSGDAAAYVRALKAAGYFTASLALYERAVLSLVSRFEALIAGMAPPPEDEEPPRSPASDADLADRVAALQLELGPGWDEMREDRDAAVAGGG